MPHIILEYSANLREAVAAADVLTAVSDAVIALRDETGAEVYPRVGLRARAISYDEFKVADAQGAYGFAHLTLKIGAGRTEAIERATAQAAFAVLRERLAQPPDLLVALSVALERLSEATSLKHNAIRNALARAQPEQSAAPT